MNKEKLQKIKEELVNSYRREISPGMFVMDSWVSKIVEIIDALLED